MDQSVTRAGIFQRVEPDAVAAVTERLLPAEFLPGQMIFAEGQPGDRLYVIESGKVKISQRAPDGRENLQTVLGPPEMFGELAVYDPGPRTSSATAITQVRAMAMDRAGCAGGSPITLRPPSICCVCWPGGCGAPSRTGPTDLHRRAGPAGQAAAAISAAVRQPGARRHAGVARSDPRGARSVGLRQP